MLRYVLLAGVAGLGITALPQGAQAQTQSADVLSDDQATGSWESEIIVTAQKRTERLIDTPQTVNVVSGGDLDRFNVTRFDDVAKLVPGLSITRGSGREQAVSLRGVAFDPDSQTNRTVDIYLNEVPFDPSQALQAQFDIGSIQVLRGPQGTLRGGTGPSGAILIGTRLPDLEKIEVNGNASYTDRESVNLQGGVSFPVIPGKLAVRVAGLYDKSFGNNTRSLVNDQEDRSRSYGGRISVLFQPTENLSFMVMHQQFRSKVDNLLAVASAQDVPLGRFGLIDPSDRVSATLGGNRLVTKGRATILNATWDFGENRLSYVGSYQNNDFNTTRDLNLAGALAPSYLAFIPVPQIAAFANQPYQQYQRIDTKTKTFTNEARFERTGDHFWLYRFGIYFSDSKAPFDGLIDYTGANGACQSGPGALGLLSPAIPCLELGDGPAPKTHDRGFFTTQTFNFTEQDTLDLGIRYSRTHVVNPPNSQKFDAWTGTASYKHSFSDAAIVYASYGRSFRPGGFDSSAAEQSSGPNGIPISYFSWGSEKSDSYEIGIKGALFNNRLVYALSAFYQKFDGFINRVNNVACNNNPQVDNSSTGCAGSGLVNLTYQGDASVRGAELDLRGQINRNWDAQVTMSYANAHYDNALIPCNDSNNDGIPDSGGAPTVQPGQYVSTCRLNAALSAQPKFQLSANSEYRVDLPDDFQVFARGLARYRGKGNNPNTNVATPDSFKVDAFLGVRTPVGAEVSLFARNLFNERNDIVLPGQIFDLLGAPTGYTQVVYDQRREFGIQARVDF